MRHEGGVWTSPACAGPRRAFWAFVGACAALLVGLALTACAPRGVYGPCRAPDGRFVACRSRGEPVGATYDRARGWLCRDAAGVTWPSWGECD